MRWTTSGRGHAPPSTTIDAQVLHHFFDEKIAGVRKSTADAQPLRFVPAPPDCDLSSFCTLSVDDIIDAIRKLPAKPPIHFQRIFSKTMWMCLRRSSPNCLIGRCHRECFRCSSRQHTSLHYLKSQIWTLLMGSHTGPYQTSLFCRKFLSQLI